MRFCLIYVTTGSKEEAMRLDRAIVEERLVACVNIIPKIHSIYWWEGKVCREDEVMLVSKSTESLFPAIMDRVKSLHSYQVPEILSFPILEGLPDYLNWIEDVTK